MSYVTGTRAEVDAIQLAWARSQARSIGVPFGVDGYTGMAGRRPDTLEIRPPGRGETLELVRPRVSSDGTQWAVELKAMVSPELPGGRLELASLAGRTVEGVVVPASRELGSEWFGD